MASSSARRARAPARPASPSACCARFARRGVARARRQIRAGLYRSRLPCRGHRPARRQPRQLGDAPDAARRACRRSRRAAPTWSSSKAPWACSTAFRANQAARARPPISHGSTACRCCWCSTSPASRRQRRRSPRALPTYDPGVTIAGVVLNRVASERHRRLAGDAIEAIGLPVVGAIMRDPTLTLPERHLGLVQAERACRPRSAHRAAGRRDGETRSTSTRSWRWPRRSTPPAGGFRRCLAAARPAHRACRGCRLHLPLSACRSRMAAARRGACAVLAARRPAAAGRLRRLLAARRLSRIARRRLAAAAHFRAGMQRFAATRPVHGECGGFMVLGEALEDADGETHEMLGLLGHATSFAKRR